jgi:hypothetical protein
MGMHAKFASTLGGERFPWLSIDRSFSLSFFSSFFLLSFLFFLSSPLFFADCHFPNLGAWHYHTDPFGTCLTLQKLGKIQPMTLPQSRSM